MQGGRPADELDIQSRPVLDLIQEFLALTRATMAVFRLRLSGGETGSWPPLRAAADATLPDILDTRN
jgi:hypothetical protein